MSPQPTQALTEERDRLRALVDKVRAIINVREIVRVPHPREHPSNIGFLPADNALLQAIQQQQAVTCHLMNKCDDIEEALRHAGE